MYWMYFLTTNITAIVYSITYGQTIANDSGNKSREVHLLRIH